MLLTVHLVVAVVPVVTILPVVVILPLQPPITDQQRPLARRFRGWVTPTIAMATNRRVRCHGNGVDGGRRRRFNRLHSNVFVKS